MTSAFSSSTNTGSAADGANARLSFLALRQRGAPEVVQREPEGSLQDIAPQGVCLLLGSGGPPDHGTWHGSENQAKAGDMAYVEDGQETDRTQPRRPPPAGLSLSLCLSLFLY
jgi:hypothetical protein